MDNIIDFDALGVYELREYARRCGVKSPTTKKRKQLIMEIKLIEEGKMQKVVTKKGRPRKVVYLKSQDKFIKVNELYELKNLIDNVKKEVDSFRERINQFLESFFSE